MLDKIIKFTMLVQNRIFTAEAPRTQTKHFLFGGRYRQTKRFPSFQYKPHHRCHSHQEASILFPKACLPAGRCGSAVSLILKGANA